MQGGTKAVAGGHTPALPTAVEGATDLAFVTPPATLLQLEIPTRVTDGPDIGPRVSLSDLAARGQIVAS
jgi:hypothetical protein